MRRLLLFAVLIASAGLMSANSNAAQTCPNDSTGHAVPSCSFAGNSLAITQQNGVGVVDVSFPIYSPPPGNYAPLYAGSASSTGTDDFSTLSFTGVASATYTMPPSHTTSFTGSISGATLTTSAGTVIAIGDLITNAAGTVAAGTYVKSGAGTSWTVNVSQTVGSTTLTATSFPPGHGVCFKNNGAALLTITAVTSAVNGAPGVVSGTPAAPGGPVTLFPQGEACLSANLNNNYAVSGFQPGVMFQNVASLPNPAAMQWPLSGYQTYHIHCLGVTPTTEQDTLLLQTANNGVFQSGTYTWSSIWNYVGNTTVGIDTSTTTGPATAFKMTGGVSSPTDLSAGAGATLDVTLDFSDGTGAGFRRGIVATASYESSGSELMYQTYGAAPYNTTNQSITGVKIFTGATGSNLRTGLCWLKPSL